MKEKNSNYRVFARESSPDCWSANIHQERESRIAHGEGPTADTATSEALRAMADQLVAKHLMERGGEA